MKWVRQMHRIEIIGVHPLEVSEQMLEAAFQDKYGWLCEPGGDRPDPAEVAAARRRVQEELRSAVLLEVWVHERDDRFDFGDFSQPTDQVAWDEVILSADGEAVRVQNVLESDLASIPDRDLRVAFWLHYDDANQPIHTSYGEAAAPSPTPMPDRLRRIIEYRHVD